jgi:hypothetical protein
MPGSGCRVGSGLQGYRVGVVSSAVRQYSGQNCGEPAGLETAGRDSRVSAFGRVRRVSRPELSVTGVITMSVFNH